MFSITNLDTLISISAKGEAYKAVKELSSFGLRSYEEGMSGYDMRDFLEKVLPDKLLKQVEMNPESGGFYCYMNPEQGEVSEKDLAKAQDWVDEVSGIISSALIEIQAKILEAMISFVKKHPGLKEDFLTNLNI